METIRMMLQTIECHVHGAKQPTTAFDFPQEAFITVICSRCYRDFLTNHITNHKMIPGDTDGPLNSYVPPKFVLSPPQIYAINAALDVTQKAEALIKSVLAYHEEHGSINLGQVAASLEQECLIWDDNDIVTGAKKDAIWGLVNDAIIKLGPPKGLIPKKVINRARPRKPLDMSFPSRAYSFLSRLYRRSWVQARSVGNAALFFAMPPTREQLVNLLEALPVDATGHLLTRSDAARIANLLLSLYPEAQAALHEVIGTTGKVVGFTNATQDDETPVAPTG
jgi:hypothetical protein